ncbi:hypothetical protein RIF29_33726 [Crotalaria pallida]|uniref:Uncharacterized protein n=1 Tax=Crotalaria pallida TaxID=3830 RepID=A0AAN9EAY2_CROPI
MIRAQGGNDGVGVGVVENGTQGSAVASVAQNVNQRVGPAPNGTQGSVAASDAQNVNQGAVGASTAEDGNHGISHSVAGEPAPKRRKAKASVVVVVGAFDVFAAADVFPTAAVVPTATTDVVPTASGVAKRKKSKQSEGVLTSTTSQPMTRILVRKQSAMTQPLTWRRIKKMYKGSSSKKLVVDDFQDPCPNITIAQLLNGYMAMMEKVQNESRKKGIVSKGDNKEKGDGKKRGGKD